MLEEFFDRSPRMRAPPLGGPIELIDQAGEPIPEDFQEIAWKHLRSELLSQITERCEVIKSGIDELAMLHRSTPPPSPGRAYMPAIFASPEPEPPVAKSYQWLWKWLAPHRARVDRENDLAGLAHDEDRRSWLADRAKHDRAQSEQRKLFLERDSGTVHGVEKFIGWHLAGIIWPQDTAVDLKVVEDGRRIFLDVDLPEIEDLPNGVPQVIARSRALRIKPFSDAAKRRLYASHVHAVVFRLVGEAFHACPTAETVIASGYSQRCDASTGVVGDEYLLSVLVNRCEWAKLNFTNLGEIDPIESLARFELRRNMTKTGVFLPVVPFECE